MFFSFGKGGIKGGFFLNHITSPYEKGGIHALSLRKREIQRDFSLTSSPIH
jgi:hypothetical protein